MSYTDSATIDVKPRFPSQEEQELVIDIIREFSQFQAFRNTTASHWEEVAQLILPTSRNTFFYGNYNWPGQKKTQQQVDASGMMALHRFAAICDSLLTPRNMPWHGLMANNDYVMKDRETRLWFEQVTKILFKFRYTPLANFAAQNNNCFQSLGAFGNAVMFVNAFDGRQHHGTRGIRYKAVPMGECFFGENHQGVVDRVVRWFRLTARQAVQKWGIERLPINLQAPLMQHSQYLYNFLHCVRPREDYDPERLDHKGMPFGSYYVSIEGKCLMAPESGFRVFPYGISRYDQAPNEVYGRGPAMMVLPALKTLNAEKTTFLKQGHRASDPILLTTDDGVVDFKMRPGALNKGGMSQDGKLLVGTVPVGNIQITEKMMDEERALINDAFLVNLFQLALNLKDLPQMTATQVVEIMNQKGILIAPSMGRQQSEYLGSMIERELDVLGAQGLLPAMPPRLREAGGEYQVVYTSPLALAARSGEAAGFIRAVETSKEIVNITGDRGYLDWADFDAAMPEIARIQSSPERWIASDDQITAKRRARAQQEAKQQAIQAAPAQAALMSAQAKQAKAGMMQPQQGAPQQQPMPGMMPQ